MGGSVRAWLGPHGVLMEGLDGPTPDESFVAPAHLTGLAFMQSSTARSTTEVSGQAGSDNDMLSGSMPITGDDGSGCRRSRLRTPRPADF
jgi:hypothetical protein